MPETTKKKKQKKKKDDSCNEIINRNNSNQNRGNKNKTNVYILGDRIFKKFNGYLVSKKIRHKRLVKMRLNLGAKISCMTN